MRLVAEVETYLLPYVKKIEFFKEKKFKDHALTDLAISLKYEFHPRETIITDLGKITLPIYTYI